MSDVREVKARDRRERLGEAAPGPQRSHAPRNPGSEQLGHDPGGDAISA